MKIVITGAEGFLGWHLSCRLRSTRGLEAKRLGRSDWTPESLSSSIADAEVVIHLAGVNRATSDAAVERGNLELAHTLATAIRTSDSPVHVVYANTVHSGIDSAYGRGKAAAVAILAPAIDAVGGTLGDVLLPNLFGEHGRPGYNSFVATFCHEVASGRVPEVTADREIPLLHVQSAAEALIRAAERRQNHQALPGGEPRRISEVLTLVQGFKKVYDHGEIPQLDSNFKVDLFNTYRSYLFPGHYPIHPKVHSDARGKLFETVRVHGGTGQVFVSTTAPGQTRGDHYHLRKIERFFVVKGEAEIKLRRLFGRQVFTFTLSGDRPGFIDMPTMWAHNIRNVGNEELITMFWADQLMDPGEPDQYPEQVAAAGVTQ